MRKVNFTLECETDEQAYFLDIFLRDNYKVLDYSMLPDTKQLYEDNKHFRSLVGAVRKVQRIKNDYINNYNNKKNESK